MNQLPLNAYLIFSALLFGLGMLGVILNRKNILVMLLCLELVLLAINTNFVACARYNANITGEIFVVFTLTVAAIKTALGLAILVLLVKKKYAFVSNCASHARNNLK